MVRLEVEQYVKEHPGCTCKEIAEAIGVGKSQVYQALKKNPGIVKKPLMNKLNRWVSTYYYLTWDKFKEIYQKACPTERPKRRWM